MKKEKKIIRRSKVGQTGRRQRKKEEENYLGSRSIREVGHEKRKKGEEIIYNTVPGSSRYEIVGHDDFRRSKTKRDGENNLAASTEEKRERVIIKEV